MKVTLVLGDYARVTDGKLDILGGGWNLNTASPVTMGVGLIVEVPWNETNRKHTMRLTLLGADGELVQLPGPNGQQQTIEVTTEFELGRPPGVAPGTSLPFALAINVNQVPLPRNQRFEWRLDIDGRTEPDWHVSFQTLDPMPPAFGPRLGN